MLFLDDAKMKNFTSCFKEKHFLKFFFSRLRLNETQSYPMFPFISLCGRERNYIRCDDTPIVFTEQLMKTNDSEDLLSYAHGGPALTVAFQPHKIYMHPESGRVYHPAWSKVGGIGLIRSKLAIELSQNFIFREGGETPTHFNWRDTAVKLEHDWVKDCLKFGINYS
ncbi:GH21678 [Drosophila grimshawi]|uniref:GH21678 n=2 Tax=Drosophila grimshawi TaxID=7222 RepID=B4J612_DROGR|nr:GH21678 [Drosophila grimshawi]